MGSARRIGAFAAKETVELVHQPRLIAAMIIGPFAILALFGAGLSSGLPRFTALFVAPDRTTGAIVDRHADELASYIDYAGVVADRDTAIAALRAGDVDVVAVLPADPLESVRNDRRAVITVYHDSLDPVVAAAVDGAARLAADELNRQIIGGIVARAQTTSSRLARVLPVVRDGLTEVRALLDAGRDEAARAELRSLAGPLEVVADAGVDALPVVEAFGRPGAPGTDPSDLRTAVRRLEALTDAGSVPSIIAQVAMVRSAVEVIEADLASLTGVRPEVLLRPLRAVTEPVGTSVPEPLDFYLPSILMLLLQHVGITFSALSLVRERELASLELFTVAPVTASDVLLGKCVAYTAMGGVVAAVVGLTLWQVVDVPLHGDVAHLVVGMGAVLVASIGAGFLISLVSRTSSQAVQLALITLLASFFFSGFFLPLDRLAPIASLVGSFLPVTHGISIARDVVLRGSELPEGDVGQLAAIALGAGGLTWMGVRRLIGVR